MSGGGGTRQKMINMMYVVYIGLNSLNVSSDVLNGYAKLEEGLMLSIKTTGAQNEYQYARLVSQATANPGKGREWHEKGMAVKEKSDALFNYLQDLKERLAKRADADEEQPDPENLVNKQDLKAGQDEMLVEPNAQGRMEGEIFEAAIDDYRTFMMGQVVSDEAKAIIERSFNTDDPPNKLETDGKSWLQSMFEMLPVAAIIPMLTKLQSDIRNAEGAAMSLFVKQVDLSDFIVNELRAFVIPETQSVMRGSTYRADIVLAAVDSTQKPKIVVNGKELDSPDGRFVASATTVGTFPLKGTIAFPRTDGSFIEREFSTQYFVMEPSATIAPTLMNILYAGIKNEIRIAVPGVPMQNVTASCSNGALTPKGVGSGLWEVNPKYGSDAIITVQARIGDRSQEMAKNTFKVRPLPPPTAYLMVAGADGNRTQFKGGTLPKAQLLNTPFLSAAIDDGILNIPFTVLGFETTRFDSMGFAIKEISSGANFTDRQKALIRSMSKGQTLLIRAISTRGPDGVTQTLKSPLEIIII
ncbi:gliding motility protein GldM [Bacteroidia bacterium]|nr:gliding motility protein GldM [Bacteroidia bacterium]